MAYQDFTKEELKKIEEAVVIYYYYGEPDESFDFIDEYGALLVRTHETTDDFKQNANSWKDISRACETGNGWSLDVIHSYQLRKGEPREDLLIIDLGNVRCVVR